MRGNGKRIGGIEAIKVGMDETGVSGFVIVLIGQCRRPYYQ